MKTSEQITKLNFNDLSFFRNITATDSKWLIYNHYFKSEKDLKDNLSATGKPKIGISDTVDKSAFETKMISNSHLDGKNNIDYHIDYYNNGVPLNTLREFSQNEPYRKALKFTGKKQILNDILKPSQLLQLQKTWLEANIYSKKTWSKQTALFIQNTEWAVGHLKSIGISKSQVERQLVEPLKKEQK